MRNTAPRPRHVLLALTIVALTGLRAGATTITVDAWLELETKDAGKVVLDLLAIYSRGGQAASVFAAAGPIKYAGIQSAPYDGDTGYIWAAADYRDNVAAAVAQSSQASHYVYAVAGGSSAYALASLAWDGRIRMQSELEQLPPIDEIIDACMKIQYGIQGVETYVSGASYGALSLEHSWDGVTSLNGEVQFGDGYAEPEFSGNLAAYSGEFGFGSGALSCSAFDIWQEAAIPIDYAAFYELGYTEVSYAGSLVAEASAVPEPGTAFVLGLGVAAAALRRAATNLR